MHSVGSVLVSGIVVSSIVACGAAPPPDVEEAEAAPIASTTEAATVNALTPKQSKTVLGLVDEVCGDTWCDGDYDFGFRRLTCSRSASTCTLTFQIFPREGVVSDHRSYWRSCKTHDFSGFASLVTTAPNGYQSLEQGYYDALTECMSRIESKLR